AAQAKKQAQHRRPRRFSCLFYHIFRRAARQVTNSLPLESLLCQYAPFAEKRAKKQGTESRACAPFRSPTAIAGCNRSKLFLVKDGHDVHKVAVIHHGIAVKR